MIIETKGDVVRLSGALRKNQWLTIKAAARLLLDEHKPGIIVDCSDLTEVSEDGARTFLEAMHDIEAADARIIVASLPQQVRTVLKAVPGLRSGLVIAESVAEARASLKLAAPAPTGQLEASRKTCGVTLVPLISGLDLTYGAHLASRVARSGRTEIQIVYFVEVARTLPLNAPLGEQEKETQRVLDRARQYAEQKGVTVSVHVERVREAADSIIAAIRDRGADLVVVATAREPADVEAQDRFHGLVLALLNRAHCEVVVGRQLPPQTDLEA